MHKYLILDSSGKPLMRGTMRQALHGGVCRMELEHEEDAEKLGTGELFQLMGIPRRQFRRGPLPAGPRGVGGV